jgi:pimeloyl-ACP methyl ester carboxylesterase
VPEAEVNGVRLHYQRVGSPEGETVVMLHGMLVDNLSSLYLTLAPVLVRDMDVVLYDQRGHGRSQRPATGYGVEQSVDDLTALLDHLGIDGPVHLLGNSYGALVAIETALARPGLVASLVLIEAHFAVDGWGDHMAHDLELAGFGLSEEDVQTWLGEFGGRKLNRLARKVEALIKETSIIADLRAARPLEADALRGLDLPALALYGEHSDAIARARDLEALLPTCQLDLLADCAHSALFEATKTVRGIVGDWYAARRRGEPAVRATRRIKVGEAEGEGAMHQEHVDFYKAELERRMGAAAGATNIRIAPRTAGRSA